MMTVVGRTQRLMKHTFTPFGAFAGLCVVIPVTALATLLHVGEQPSFDMDVIRSASPALAHQVSLPPMTVERTVALQKGEAFVDALTRAGFSRSQANSLSDAAAAHHNLRRLQAGQDLTVRYTEDKPYNISEANISLRPAAGEELRLSLQGEAVTAKLVKHKLETVQRVAVGRISKSLYVDATDAGLPPALVKPFVDLFAWDLDYTRDIHPGDTFKVVYEEIRDDRGERVKSGRILAASFTVKKDTKQAFWFEDSNGHGDYYNEKGEGKRKLLLRTPLETYRISSNFNLKRKHPISGYTRAHKGTDFAAPTGTPVMASGDGVVTFVGRHGGHGNFVKIKHDATYTTAYAHLSRYARGLKNGSRVKQGQIIAYVGSTGASTGPHLHYEVIKNGTHVDAMNTKLPTGVQMAGGAKRKFLAMVDDIKGRWAKALTQLASL